MRSSDSPALKWRTRYTCSVQAKNICERCMGQCFLDVHEHAPSICVGGNIHHDGRYRYQSTAQTEML